MGLPPSRLILSSSSSSSSFGLGIVLGTTYLTFLTSWTIGASFFSGCGSYFFSSTLGGSLGLSYVLISTAASMSGDCSLRGGG